MSEKPLTNEYPNDLGIQPGIANELTILPVNPNNPTVATARDTVLEIAANQKLQMSEQQRMRLAMRRAKNVEAGAEKNLEKAPTINVHEAIPSEKVMRGNSFDKNILEAYLSAHPSTFKFSFSVVVLFFLAILITLLTKPKK